MCGIGAIIQNDHAGLNADIVKSFSAAISHRGPDGAGFEYFPESASPWRVALVHRRLSIIDLSETGDQPMCYGNRELCIVFNGEIYNYVEIREVLKRIGRVFRGTSDTEVILAAYSEWGPAAFARLRGMWAIVLYDRRLGKIFVCRDRLGIKPLYYFRHTNYIAFGSEIKQFLTFPEFVAAPDKSVLKQYIMTGFEATDRTFFENVAPVAPGTYQELDVEKLALSAPVSIWSPENIIPNVKDARDAALSFGAIFEDSLKVHLRSDVPVGCQLSGGVDSSSVFALMRKHYPGVVDTFTIQFPGYKKDETPFVNIMLKGAAANPHFATAESSSFMADLDSFTWHHDEPVGSFAHYAGFILARDIASNKVKVVLNGQGGDEILGGYWQQYYSYLFALVKHGRVGSALAHLVGAVGAKGNSELVKQMPAMLARYWSRKSPVSFSFNKSFDGVAPLFSFKQYFSMSDQERRIYDIRKLILPRLLKWDDRNLMAFGVEGRYPFLDHRVIETALSFDRSVMFRKGWTKYPLREAMMDVIPPQISRRKSKWGFETPQQKWLLGPMRTFIQGWAASEKPIDMVIDGNEVKALVASFWKSGSLEDSQLLLRLLLLDKWLQVFSIRI